MAKGKKRPAKTRAAARVQKKGAKPPKKTAVAKPARRRAAVAKAARPKRTATAAVRNPVRELAQRIVDLTISQDDEGAFALYASDVESTEPGQAPTVGLEAIKQKFAGWRTMAPHSTWRARKICVDGRTIMIEWEADVTFATGRQATMSEVAIHEIENGKIARERFYYDRSVLQP